MSDGSGLLVTGRDQVSSFMQVWFVSYADGRLRRITNDLTDYEGVCLTGDSRAMVVTQGHRLSNVWTAPRGGLRRAVQTPLGPGRYFDLAWSPDGRILYASDASGSADIWEMKPDGTD